ncbi:small polypeptide DEVIL 14-like [Rhodamnia argentea]|uniref:Small polypeptide DEVIL 14-like n=1 Tax=Rhodamnia argentea TaxID=178133 RepID=A0A8B8R027_9MYRT|nr:small polypeptide DEVIL 14-like [Rhodamnia argentea]
MGGTNSSATNTVRTSLKPRSWQRCCSEHIREQRARLYLVWRCTVILICWQD